MRIETHVHTRYSHDSLLSLKLLYLMCRLRQIGCIAITDHNTIKGAVEFKKYCELRKRGPYVIIGEEIMTSRGEVIGLYLKEEIPPGLTPEVTIRKIKKQGGIVYIPHPYDEKRQRTVMPFPDLEKNTLLIDCIECYNGRNISAEYGQKQMEVALRLAGIKVIGSDAHTFLELGRNYMSIENGYLSKPEYFLSEVQKAKFHEAPCLRVAHRITKLAKMMKFISKGDIYGLFRVINGKLRGGMP